MLILVPELALALLNRNIQPRGNEGGRTNDAKGEKMGLRNQSSIYRNKISGGVFGAGG